jgi:molybdenum cofactor synthesis domain-containing protein
MELNLLEKTTFWVDDIELAEVDLGALAAAAARAIDLPVDEVMVVDVRPGLVAFDVLRPKVLAEAVVGKERVLLDGLAKVPGVTLGPAAAVHSEGVLGFIALDPISGAKAVEAGAAMAVSVLEKVARRAIVFASGSEVRDSKILDTNSPYLVEVLEKIGLQVKFGGVLEDHLASVVAALEDAIGRGHGLVVTTGGVGAEDKDFNVEAVLRVDPGAHTPWILRFEPDMRRHHKPGVRIAVGRIGPTLLVALPGPHDEVRVAGEVLASGLASGMADGELAEALASVIRERWLSKMANNGGNHVRRHDPV